MPKYRDALVELHEEDASRAGLSASKLRAAAQMWPTLNEPFFASLYHRGAAPPWPSSREERLLVGVVARELAALLLAEDLLALTQIVAELACAPKSADEIAAMQRMLDIGGVGLGTAPQRAVRDGSKVEHWNARRALYVLIVREQHGLGLLARAWNGARDDAERKRAAAALTRWWRPREFALAKSIGDLHGTAEAREATLASWRLGQLP